MSSRGRSPDAELTGTDPVTVPEGYKRTEVGVIPEDWDVKTVSDLFSVTAGGDYDSRRSQSLRDERHPYPIYSNTIADRGLHGYCSYGVHPAGSITVTARGTLGVASYRSHQYTAIGRVLVLRPKQAMDGRFFVEFINSRLTFAVESTGVPQLTAPQASRYKLPDPSLAEQQAIASTLSHADSLVTALDKLIAKKQAIKQAAMQQLLTGKTRLPGFAGEWAVKRIADFADSLTGGTPSTSNGAYWGGHISWMNSGELHLKTVREVVGRITEQGLLNSSTRLLPAKCVLIGLAGQGRTRGTVAINLVELCTNQSIAAVLPNDTFVPEYVYYNLDSRYRELRGMSTGASGRGALNLQIVRSTAIPMPDIEEQQAIATVLSDVDAEIGALERQLEKIRAIKHGMMQQLLTGRTRLPRGTSA